MTRRWLLLLLSIVAVGWMTAFGQDDCRRRWAINAGGSPFAQPVQTGSYPRAIVVTHGTEWFVTGELALPGGGIDMGSNYADRGMYHDLSVGLKVNFPFCFREGDAWTLFYMILDNILY